MRRNARLKTQSPVTYPVLGACVQAESDETARYTPGSAIYLGKQNRVRCRAAMVSKKHLSDEDGLAPDSTVSCNWPPSERFLA